ncbi:MAG: hypothetical protein WBB25_01905 [Sulfitobacter sp.]
MTGMLSRLAARGVSGAKGQNEGAVLTAPLQARFWPDGASEMLPDTEIKEMTPANPAAAPRDPEPNLERADHETAPAMRIAPVRSLADDTAPASDVPTTGREAVVRHSDASPAHPSRRDRPTRPVPEPLSQSETVSPTPLRASVSPVLEQDRTLKVSTASPEPIVVDPRSVPVPAGEDRPQQTSLNEHPVAERPRSTAAWGEPSVQHAPMASPALAPALSIGRIEVIFEKPASPKPPPAGRQRVDPKRTSGFDAYSARRLGRRR